MEKLKYNTLFTLNMVNMTLAVPEELHKLMKKHADIKWSEGARRALGEKAKKIEDFDKMLENSKLTEEDVKVIGAKIKRSIAKRHGL